MIVARITQHKKTTQGKNIEISTRDRKRKLKISPGETKYKTPTNFNAYILSNYNVQKYSKIKTSDNIQYFLKRTQQDVNILYGKLGRHVTEYETVTIVHLD